MKANHRGSISLKAAISLQVERKAKWQVHEQRNELMLDRKASQSEVEVDAVDQKVQEKVGKMVKRSEMQQEDYKFDELLSNLMFERQQSEKK